jgi:hypothetical protein
MIPGRRPARFLRCDPVFSAEIPWRLPVDPFTTCGINRTISLLSAETENKKKITVRKKTPNPPFSLRFALSAPQTSIERARRRRNRWHMGPRLATASFKLTSACLPV